jgi:predicted dehydrogenase
MSSPVEIIIVGAGDRGSEYSKYALLHPDQAKIVGVAEPRPFYRQRMAEKHQIPAENVFDDWQTLATQDRLADAVIIATQDKLHEAPAIALAEKGYHMLLEKPMAPTPDACRRIVEAVEAAGIIFGVCHVMRFTNYTRKLKELITSGLIGDLISIQHLEPVGYWHFTHSFVRGNWRNESQSAPILLAKSCHDVDWLRHIMGTPCVQVSSFGSLRHFKKENQPQTAGDRCLDCDHEPQCPYSAKRIYPALIEQGLSDWLASVLTPDLSPEGITQALRDGPYGRCVYACDNDVVDHQVVNMDFEGGRTATFTMTAFTPWGDRKTKLFGSLGQLYGDGSRIEHYDFLTDQTYYYETPPVEQPLMEHHGGGDYNLISSFVSAVSENDPGLILSGPQESLETHQMVFAAEEARQNHRVVDVPKNSSG